MFYIISTTTNSNAIAEKISKIVLNSNYSPCIQIQSNIISNYLWKNESKQSKEYKINIKTIDKYTEKITSIITENHNYDIPEIIKYKFDINSNDYKDWFLSNIKPRE